MFVKYSFIVIIPFFIPFIRSDQINPVNDETAALLRRTETYLKNRYIVPKVYAISVNGTSYEAVSNPLWLNGQKDSLRIAGFPCGCYDTQCGCCANINIPIVNINQGGCFNLTYDPYLFALIMDVKWNNQSVAHNIIVSGKNPAPVCIPIPTSVVPGLPSIQLDFCIKLFDIYTPDVRNVHVCMDWEIRLYNTSILILHFDCLRYGLDGAAVLKPGDDGNLNFGNPPSFPFSGNQTTSPAPEDYDEVTEVKDYVPKTNTNKRLINKFSLLK